MIIIFTIRRFKPMIPGALVALILGTIITAYYDLNQLYGVSIVGVIPTGLPAPSIPRVDLSTLGFLISGAAGIVFLAAGETLGTARAFAAKYHYEVDADQELLAMGTANITSGLFGGITIDMSLSSTASGESAGERTQLSSLVSAGLILLVVLFLAPLLQNLPTAVLGAIVLSSILGLFNFAELRRYYTQRKTDFLPGGYSPYRSNLHRCDDWFDVRGFAFGGDVALPRQPTVYCYPRQAAWLSRRLWRYQPKQGNCIDPGTGYSAPGCAAVFL